MKILIATTNEGKVAELRSLLSDERLEFIGLDALPEIPDVEETGSTFAANAKLKAVTYSSYFGLHTLADDSGLEVDALYRLRLLADRKCRAGPDAALETIEDVLGDEAGSRGVDMPVALGVLAVGEEALRNRRGSSGPFDYSLGQGPGMEIGLHPERRRWLHPF